MAAASATEESGEAAYPGVIVDTPAALASALEDLGGYGEVAFDCEGRNLSRTGDLTVACFLGIGRDGKPGRAYVVDVVRLGAAAVFPAEGGGLKALLEREDVVKVTFDCRGDSDALFHQFGVRLAGVIDAQVMDQACRIGGGEAPPARRGGWVPFIKGMSRVAERYLDERARRALGHHLVAPHKDDPDVWVARPLSADAVRYAAADVYTIALMLARMREAGLSEHLMERVRAHSARYARYFRELPAAPEWPADKHLILEEHSILGECGE